MERNGTEVGDYVPTAPSLPLAPAYIEIYRTGLHIAQASSDKAHRMIHDGSMKPVPIFLHLRKWSLVSSLDATLPWRMA